MERLAAIGHPLFNRWEEHRDIIEASLKAPGLPKFEPLIFVEKKGQRIGNGTGYRINLSKGVTLKGQTIELIPPKSDP